MCCEQCTATFILKLVKQAELYVYVGEGQLAVVAILNCVDSKINEM